jgi:hypothetical protein
MSDERRSTLREVVEIAAAGNTEAEDLERIATEALAGQASRTPLMREVVEKVAAGIAMSPEDPIDRQIDDLEEQARAALAAEPQDLEARVYRREALAHHRHLSELRRAVDAALQAFEQSGIDHGVDVVEAINALALEQRRIREEPPIDPMPSDGLTHTQREGF